MHKSPNWRYEKLVWKKGYRLVAGLDEAGRGSFAGPIVCGCAVFSQPFRPPNEIRIDDSKKLTQLQREKSYEWIIKNALSWGVGVGSVTEINRKGIVKTTSSGFRRAVVSANNKVNTRIVYLLIDAFYIPYVRGIRMPYKRQRKQSKTLKNTNTANISGSQLAIIHGDAKSVSIAAASIIAKVYRDKLMIEMSRKPRYKKYCWEKNKGYGTAKHRRLIKKYGINKYHRKKYVETFLNNTRITRKKER